MFKVLHTFYNTQAVAFVVRRGILNPIICTEEWWKNDEGDGMADVVIVGAGLTGLSMAYHLEQQGFLDYVIFEKYDRVGGLLKSVNNNGFTFDHTGHFLHINDPYVDQFFSSVIGRDGFQSVARQTAIYSHNVFTDYPFQINLYGLPTDVAAECIEGFVRRHQRIKNPTTFYDWVLKHFGPGMGKHFFFSYNQKLFGYDIKKIHPSWTGRFVPSTTLSSIIAGTIQRRPPAGVGYNSMFWYPEQGGIELLIHRLEGKLHNQVRTNHDVVAIDMVKKEVVCSNGRREPYKTLVTTMPLNTFLARVVQSSRCSYQEHARNLLCNSVVNFNLGFKSSIDFNYHWLYFPEKKYDFYRLGFWHNISRGLVPSGGAAVYGEMAYVPTLVSKKSVEQKKARAAEQILQFVAKRESDVSVNTTLELEHAYVIYNAWRQQHLARLLKQLVQSNVYSIGRYGEWKYASMQEAVLDGKRMSEAVIGLQKNRQVYVMPAQRFQTKVVEKNMNVQRSINNERE